MQDRSRGVQILANPCEQERQIATGTIFRLAPGARLWLATGRGERQAVCQSRATSALTLLVDQSHPPWLSSKSLPNCLRHQNRWRCLAQNTENEILTCAMTRLRPPPSGPSSPKEATSLVLRSLQSHRPSTEYDDARQLPARLKQEAEMCHELYGVEEKFPFTWHITPQGKTAAIESPPALRKSHPHLLSCLEELIRSHTYPPTDAPGTLTESL